MALDLERPEDGPSRVAKLADGLAPILDLDGLLTADEWADVGRTLFDDGGGGAGRGEGAG